MYTFKYGGQDLELKKSEKYIGIKASEGQGEQVSRDINDSPNMDIHEHYIGGFTVLSTPDNVDAGKQLDDLRSKDNISQGTHVYEHAEGSDPIVPTGELYIVFKEGAKHNDALALLDKFKLKVTDVRDKRTLIAEITGDSMNPIKVAMGMQESPAVEICEPNFAYRMKHAGVNMPADEFFPQQWFLKNTGVLPTGETWGLIAGADAKVVDAWNELGHFGSSNIVIAVVDDGFDLSHPKFQGKIVAPIDFETKSTTSLILRSDDTHGTNCAGVAIASITGKGSVGAAPNARFMPIRTYGIDDIILERLFTYLVTNGADIISNSWGIPGKVLSSRAMAAINKAATQGRNGKGCIILFAAGNEGDKVTGFATHPDVICVGASSSIDKWSSYSNQGPAVWITAPSNGDNGWPIVTTDAGTVTLGDGTTQDIGYTGLYRDDFGGTSSATPLAAGCIALILSANPNLTSAQIKDILKNTSDKIGSSADYDGNGHSDKYGYGRINTLRAVRMAKSLIGAAPVTNAVTPQPTPTITQSDSTTSTTDTPDDTAADTVEAPSAPDTTPTPAPTTATPPPPSTSVLGLPLKAVATGALSGTGDNKLYCVIIGNQLVVQAKTTSGDLDAEIFMSKDAMPDLANGIFDTQATSADGQCYIINNDANEGDYYLAVHSKSGAGSYAMQVTLGATGHQLNPAAVQLKLQALAQNSFVDSSAVHYYRVTIGKRLAIDLTGPTDFGQDFDLYMRKDAVPAGKDYDATSAEAGTTEEILLQSEAIQLADYYVLVQSSNGDGNFNLTVQLG